MPQEEISTLEELFPYMFAAVSIALSAVAYYVRDVLRQHGRVLKQKDEIDLARREIDLKLNEQEMRYKRELQDTITELNEQMSQMQARHQASLDQEIQARIALEKRITEIETQHQSELGKLLAENERLSRENIAFRQQFSQTSDELDNSH